MGIFDIEPGLAIWTWVAFGLLLFVMSKYVFPILIQNIKDREKAISDAVDNAEEIKKRLDKIEEEHSEIISRSKKESDKILRDTREQSEKLKKELLHKAEAEANEIIEEAKNRIDEERNIAVEEIKKEMATLICEITEKVVGHSFLEDVDRKWVKERVDDV